MFFICYGIFFGLLILGIKHLTNIPYTPMLLALGIAIGAAGDYLWAVGDAM